MRPWKDADKLYSEISTPIVRIPTLLVKVIVSFEVVKSSVFLASQYWDVSSKLELFSIYVKRHISSETGYLGTIPLKIEAVFPVYGNYSSSLQIKNLQNIRRLTIAILHINT